MSVIISDLAERFTQPSGWRTHSFKNPNTGHEIHFGSVFPSGAAATAVVVCLPGLSEFSEKYYEVARDMLSRGYAFWCIDWQYQGRSGRMSRYPQRRHSDGIGTDLDDLHRLITDYIKPASVHPGRGRTPLIMLAHSMGGGIGLRYLVEHPGVFSAAAFNAPLLGIYNFSKLQGWAAKILSALPVVNRLYVPGGKDWNDARRKGDGSEIFSSDPSRDYLHSAWSKADPALQIGDPTIRWVAETLKSFAVLQLPGKLESIAIPTLFAIAGKDTIVDNAAIQAASARIHNSRLLELTESRHEILVEQDAYRNAFFDGFDKMIKDNKIIGEDPKPL